MSTITGETKDLMHTCSVLPRCGTCSRVTISKQKAPLISRSKATSSQFKVDHLYTCTFPKLKHACLEPRTPCLYYIYNTTTVA